MIVTLIVMIVILVVAMFIGTPVSTALGLTACLIMMFFANDLLGAQLLQFGKTAYAQGTSMNMMIAPLFIVMAEFLSRGGIADDIFEILNRRMKMIKGGLAIGTVLACTVFAALCGTSAATAASVGRISIGAMIKRNYDPAFAVGTVAAGGTLGIMIPPSISLVFYGIITETSIAKLLMAGLLPGILLSALFIISIIIRVKLNPRLIDAPIMELLPVGKKIPAYLQDVASGSREVNALGSVLPAGVIILLVLGTMYMGITTPTEAAGVGAIATMVLVLLQRRMTKKDFGEIMRASVRTSCMAFMLVAMGFTLSYVISYVGLAKRLSETIAASGASPWTVMIMVFALWLILGCLMDPGSMVILTMPFLGTTLFDLGFDPIWVGVVATLMTEVGMITPPVGLNLFVLKATSDVPIGLIVKGAIPYLVVLFIGLVILCFFPQIALIIPNRM